MQFIVAILAFAASASGFAPAAPRATARTQLFERVEGTVKWFDSEKGYGFISVGETGDIKDVFCHYTAIATENNGYRTLEDGAKVTLEVTAGAKGPQAVDVMQIFA
ncbi:cold-shock' DNA-binding domain-containing protein, partial [Pelagophyceae sp. CCMP2097]